MQASPEHPSRPPRRAAGFARPLAAASMGSHLAASRPVGLTSQERSRPSAPPVADRQFHPTRPTSAPQRQIRKRSIEYHSCGSGLHHHVQSVIVRFAGYGSGHCSTPAPTPSLKRWILIPHQLPPTPSGLISRRQIRRHMWAPKNVRFRDPCRSMDKAPIGGAIARWTPPTHQRMMCIRWGKRHAHAPAIRSGPCRVDAGNGIVNAPAPASVA
ncbi:hypothetical protein BH10PSE12_BH10PSE12_11490 [soil metagenome]